MEAKKTLRDLYVTTRQKTESLCAPLETEDYVIQSIEDVSPPKWHLAHTTWFFETFLLNQHLPSYQVFDPIFHHLFNSYYHSMGHPFPRAHRGALSRPTVETIYTYRKYVDEHVLELIENADQTLLESIYPIIVLGNNHEQQHQELLLMDIKYNFSLDPKYPAYTKEKKLSPLKKGKNNFINFAGGIIDLGYQEKDFCFDNELPPHQVILKPYALANKLVTNGEYGEFIHAGGYQKSIWWLADGWEARLKQDWQSPLYWRHIDNKWYEFTLHGLVELNPEAPLSHVSFYEAEAYARFRDLRLPTEAEWEHSVTHLQIKPGGNLLDTQALHPLPASGDEKQAQQLFGDVWEWTASAYSPYPGYKPLRGALGEYNGKFMSNQMVLRGGSCITPNSHIRASYRNFFQPDKRWQVSGIRLAKEE